ARGDRADRRGGAPAARRRRRRGRAAGREFRTGIAGISPLHAAGRMAGPQGAGGADLRPSREGQGLAPAPGRGGHESAQAGSLAALRRRRQQDRRRKRTMTTMIDTLNQEQIAKLATKAPEFAPGDTLRVNVKVIEGTRERVQAFEGVCIARKNAGLNSSFTVR